MVVNAHSWCFNLEVLLTPPDCDSAGLVAWWMNLMILIKGARKLRQAEWVSVILWTVPVRSYISLGTPATNIQQYVTVSTEFFEFLRNGTRSGILVSGVTAPEFIPINLNESNAQGLFDGWEIHVAPSRG
ncbi:hypothetical protein NA56DRAFT_709426 [Hyaloscypha hepaticicola]|uniref:Uncharacterized protein n=1 Tax=Hyaloscypha hepaticicola TaxID=2082293 RepID=A0A2J6PPF1_9HELO|nr:hypothetical protein NA56DRAFT_709426 [Hyaloscypha hepaticicola]